MSRQNKMKRFEALDAFRGLAAVMIILFHSHFFIDSQPNAFVLQGGIFVDFFFVLSGFVMAYSYKDRILNGIGFKKFTLLRFARLYPLHLFTLLVWVPFVGVKFYLYHQGSGGNDPAEIFNIYTFTENLLLLQGFSSTTSWNYPSWSIGVEFYTYILFFAVVLLSIGLSTIGRFALLASIAFFAYLVVESHYGEPFLLQNMFRCISEFFLGVVVYMFYRGNLFYITNMITATILEIGMLLLMFYFVSNIEGDNLYRHLTIVLFAAIVYLFSVENIGYISKLLMRSLFQHLGKISYSIYMTHAIVLAGSDKVLTYLFHLQSGDVVGIPKGLIFEYAIYVNLFLIMVIIGLSTLTYKYIEIRGQLYFKRRFVKYDT